MQHAALGNARAGAGTSEREGARSLCPNDVGLRPWMLWTHAQTLTVVLNLAEASSNIDSLCSAIVAAKGRRLGRERRLCLRHPTSHEAEAR
jgi:hypothetical protein